MEDSQISEPWFEFGFFFAIIFFRDKNRLIEQVNGRLGKNVPEKRKQAILNYMKKDSNITIPALAELLKVTDKTIKRDIENLKKKGLLKRIGVG